MSSLAVFFGMDLFFILSGFLIGSILLYSLKNRDTQKRPIRRFYLRRVFRTFPSYYFVLTALAFIYILSPEQRHHLWMEYCYLTNFTRLGRFDVIMFWGWSLALEEQFYLVVPLLFLGLSLLRSDRARIALLVVLWAAALVTRIAIYFSRPDGWIDVELYGALYFRTYTRFDTLITGILLAVIHDRFRQPIGQWLQRPFNRALVAMPSLLCLWMLLRPWTFLPKNLNFYHVFAWGTLTTIMYMGFLLLLLHGHGVVHRFLSAAAFRRIATLGYGVYLVHIPLCDHIVVPIAKRLIIRGTSLALVWPISLALLLAMSATLAYAMHLLIEKPSLWVRDRVAG